ncbi:MAG: hypothetical protein LBH69_01415, partial [Methanomassiliicoccaceae archaeon]|nr:hypothetical protein [Methanomassiliicoccaceae archaeon]
MSLSLSGKNVAVVSAIAIMAVIGLCVLSLNSSDTPDDPNRPDDNFKTDDLGYRVTVLGDNILSWTPSKTSRGQEDLTVIITPAAGYRISCIAAVTMNGITLKDNDYRHAGGNVTMLVGIDGHVNVYADAHPDVYDVTVTGENVASWTSTETYRNQTDLAVTVRPVTGYHVSGIISVTMNGKAVKDTDYRCTENTVTFLIKIEGEIAICADLRPNAYDVTAIGENLASWTPG